MFLSSRRWQKQFTPRPVPLGKYFDNVTHAQTCNHLEVEWTWLPRHEWTSRDYWRYFLQFHLDVWDRNMFHNRRAHPDIKKTTHRFIDPKKESHSRLRALRTLLGRCNLAHCKVLKMWSICNLHAERHSTDLPLQFSLRLLWSVRLQDIFQQPLFGDILRISRCILPGWSKSQDERSVFLK